MVEGARGHGFFRKAPLPFRVCCYRWREDLEGDIAVQPRIVGAVDL
jgi:hypothetical protein